MTDVPLKHVWKIKESRIVFKDFDNIDYIITHAHFLNQVATAKVAKLSAVYLKIKELRNEE